MMVMRFFYRILCGFFLGVSIFAPGFSGSIVAIAMGIYQDMLRIISNPFKPFKQNAKFCFPLLLGVAISAVLFILTFEYLFDTYEKATYLLFVGLVVGNLPVILTEAKKCGFKKRYLIGGISAFAAAFSLGVFAIGIESATGSDVYHSNLLLWALGGFVGGISALIPGMSVSIILMLIGIYYHLLHAVGSLLQIIKAIYDHLVHAAVLQLDLTYLLPFGLFCVFAVVGLVAASKVIKLIFKKYPGFSNITVFGFVSGSLIAILIQSLQLNDPNFNWLQGCVMLAVGAGFSMLFLVLGKKMKTSGIKE
jgi:putative membrane protein